MKTTIEELNEPYETHIGCDKPTSTIDEQIEELAEGIKRHCKRSLLKLITKDIPYLKRRKINSLNKKNKLYVVVCPDYIGFYDTTNNNKRIYMTNTSYLFTGEHE